MKPIIYLFATLIISYAFSADSNYTKIINKTINLYNNHQSISYSVNFKNKNISSDDTTIIKADCILIKYNDVDKIKRIYWFSASNGQEVFSFKDKSAYIDREEGRIYESTRADHKNSVLGNIADAVIDIYFFNPDQLLNFINDSTIVTKLEPDIYHGKQMWKFEFNLPNNDGFSDIQENNWIDTESFLITRINSKIKYQGNYQYQELELKNIRFDSHDISDLEIRYDSLVKIYQVIDVDSFRFENDPRKKIINPGKNAPDFSGYYYTANKEIGLKDFKNKLILLDFWYMSCYPCQLAMPGINKLYNKYKNRGFVAFGINSKDSLKNNVRLKKFIKKNIKYPLLFVDSAVDSLYHVTAYPSFYLIDKKGNIIYSGCGFNESEIIKLDSLIFKNL